MEIKPSPDKKRLIYEHRLPNNALIRLIAESIQKARTGVHAKVLIAEDTTLLSWSFFNIDRDEERTRLANAGHKQMSQGASELFDARMLKHELDVFCSSLWKLYIGSEMPEAIAGDATACPQPFLLEPYLIDGAGTILFGPPGRGKTYLALLMGVSVDAGCTYLWNNIAQRTTLFVNLERSALSVRQRLGHINLTLGLDPARPLLMLNRRGRRLEDVREVVEAAIEKHKVGLIILDSISRAGFGKLTEDYTANATVDILNSWGVAWFATGHSGRGDQGHLYGSIMFDAGADIIMQIHSEMTERKLGIGLKVTKANDLPPIPMQIYALEFDGFGLKDARRAKAGEFASIESSRTVALKEEVIDYLLDVGPSAAIDVAQGIERDYGSIRNLFSSDEGKTQFMVTGKNGRKTLYDVKKKEVV